LYKHFQSGPVKMKVQLKIFCGNGDELKANDKWDPAKIVDVGELTIAQPPKDKDTDKLVQTLTSAVRFNPGSGFTPAGQMTIARGVQEDVSGKTGIYETSQNNRLAFNNDDKGIMDAMKGVAAGNPDVALLRKIAAEHERRQGLLRDLVKSGDATPENLNKLFAQVTREWNAK
jgi:hypothetical protein